MKSNKKILMCLVLIIILINFLVIISNNFTKTFKYNGSTIALTIDGNSATSFPTSGKYNVSVDCENASGRWNPKTWKLEIGKITGTVTCDVSFNSSVSNLTSVVNNNATRDGNGKRYEGKNPNNYIWFNDELWRIIGNIPVCLKSGCASTENRVKIIRNDRLEEIVYNLTGYSSSSPLVWIGSNVQNFLNSCYFGKASTCDDYCYIIDNNNQNTSVGCDHSSDGIDPNDFYGKMVEVVYFNVGAGDDTYKTADNYYTQEIASHATTASKIGLMYASDWGYAIEGYSDILSAETDYNNDWFFSKLSDKNWLLSNGFEWTMTAHSSTYLVRISDWNVLDKSSARALGYTIRPVLYLKSDVYVVSGTGTQVDPYRIGM